MGGIGASWASALCPDRRRVVSGTGPAAATITSARLALGGVGTVPWRARDAEGVLIGAPATVETFRAAAAAAIQNPFTVPGTACKVELAKRTIARSLETVSRSPRRNRPGFTPILVRGSS